ncbi:unnamed protein product [Rotaria socialis]
MEPVRQTGTGPAGLPVAGRVRSGRRSFVCAFVNVGLLQSITSSPPTSWTRFSFTYVATLSVTTLRFTSATAISGKFWAVDNVTVSASSSSSVNLIDNSAFESGPSVGWNVHSCGSSCVSSIMNSGDCLGGSGWCYENSCADTANLQFLEQSFDTVVGVTYNINYWLLRGGSGVATGIQMYVNMF